jgi:phosphate transport system substrate-binding protein
MGAIFFWANLTSAQVLLNASGSTFMFPIESVWSRVYQKTDSGVAINYQPIGSGGGVGQLMQRLTDFAGSDAPLSDEQLAKAPGNILHFPAALGGCCRIQPARDRSAGPTQINRPGSR